MIMSIQYTQKTVTSCGPWGTNIYIALPVLGYNPICLIYNSHATVGVGGTHIMHDPTKKLKT